MPDWDADPVAGETPIDPSGLRHPDLITNRRELARAEALNIGKAFLKYLAAKPSSRTAPFDFPWLLQLHEEMFGEVWTWAGKIRTKELNLGAPPYMVAARLAELLDDLAAWIEAGDGIEFQSVRLHHKSVQIHPFENGNGRWARLLANVWLKRHDQPIVAWPDEVLGASSAIREEYLAAVRAADALDFTPLADLHRRFRDPPA